VQVDFSTAEGWLLLTNPSQLMPLYWLCYRHNNQISVVIEPSHSLIYARLRASLDGLDEGEVSISKGLTHY
jgi:hypothetical protein